MNVMERLEKTAAERLQRFVLPDPSDPRVRQAAAIAAARGLARPVLLGEPDTLRGANVLLFPDLDAGNTAYKLVQRQAGARASGPLAQGLGHPANDLSRVCAAEEVAEVVTITSVEAPLSCRPQ